MRIAFVVDAFPVVSETFIIDQIADLIDRKVHVEIFSFQRGQMANVSSRFFTYRMHERVHYLDFPPAGVGRYVRALWPLLVCLSDPRALGRIARVADLPTPHAWPLKLLFWCAPFVGRRFDLYHCHFGPSGERFALIRELLGISQAFVTSFYGYDASVVFKSEREPYAWLKRHCRTYFVMSANMRERLIAHGFSREQIYIQPVGVNVSACPFRERSAHGGPVELISVGRMVEKKGFDVLLRALAILRRSADSWRCTIVGGGELSESVRALARELRLDDLVTFEPPRPIDDILSAFQKKDIFVQASRTAANGDME